MDEKKVNAPKKISIKNKKDATRTLAKSTIKGKANSNKSKKVSPKIANKSSMSKNKITAIENMNYSDDTIKGEVKTPNNIIRKIEKENNKEKVKRKKTSKTKESKKSKIKIDIPKEWKIINQKNKETVKSSQSKSISNPQGFKGIIKNSIFEEIDEVELIEQKKKGREKLKKNIIIFLIVVCILAVIFVALIKYNDFVKKQLAVYDVYKIGDKVVLNNNSIWYVVKDSDSKESTVTLLASTVLDVNSDGTVNDSDKLQFNTGNKAEYDIENEGSVAYFLDKSYKGTIKDLGNITEVRLLTSKEYVKIRERMGFGYDWSNDNWLANKDNNRWWVNSAQNDKVYVVKSNGTYTLVSPSITSYVRVVIVINKESAKLVEEQRKMRVDLSKGLNS